MSATASRLQTRPCIGVQYYVILVAFTTGTERFWRSSAQDSSGYLTWTHVRRRGARLLSRDDGLERPEAQGDEDDVYRHEELRPETRSVEVGRDRIDELGRAARARDDDGHDDGIQ